MNCLFRRACRPPHQGTMGLPPVFALALPGGFGLCLASQRPATPVRNRDGGGGPVRLWQGQSLSDRCRDRGPGLGHPLTGLVWCLRASWRLCQGQARVDLTCHTLAGQALAGGRACHSTYIVHTSIIVGGPSTCTKGPAANVGSPTSECCIHVRFWPAWTAAERGQHQLHESLVPVAGNGRFGRY